MNDPLTRWTEQHALLMALAIGGALLERSTLLVAAMATGSFLGLLMRFRKLAAETGPFGLANGITLARVAVTLGLLAAPDGPAGWQAGLIALLVAADGLDGWAARRFGTVSAFGHLFDQEADALLLLAVCLLLFSNGRLGGWILLPGALRYGFVLFSQMARPPQRSARGNRFTRWVGVTATLAYAACLLPAMPPEFAAGLAATVSLALAASFLSSLAGLYRTVSG